MLFILDVSRDEVLVEGRADHKMVSQRQPEKSATGAVLAERKQIKKEIFFRPDNSEILNLTGFGVCGGWCVAQIRRRYFRVTFNWARPPFWR
jgi:hypothetical protein